MSRINVSNKLIVKNSIYLYSRLVAVTIIGLLSSRYTLAALGAENYGLYSVVGGVVYAMAFINNFMVSTSYRFIAVEIGKPHGNINKAFNVSLVIHAALSLLVLILAFTVGMYYVLNYLRVPEGRLDDAVFVFVMAVINVVFVILGTPFQGLLVSKEKFSITVPIEVTTKSIALGFVIALGFMPGNRLVLYSIFITFAHILNPFVYIVYGYRKYFNEIRPRLYKGRALYLDMIKFSGWMGVGATANMFEHQGSAIIINKFFGTLLNASFGIANQVKSMVSMFAHGIGQAVVPQIAKSYSAGNEARSKRLVSFASKFSFFLLLVPVTPIMLEIDYILGVWLSSVPVYTSSFVRIILINSLVKSISSGIPTLIQASGKVGKFTLATSFTLVLSLPLAYLFFSLGYPPYAISFIFTSISIVSLIVIIVMLKAILNFDVGFFLKEVVLRDLYVVLFVVPSAGLLLLPPGWLRVILCIAVSETLLISSIYLVGMDQRERELIQNTAKSIIGKVKLLMAKKAEPSTL